MRDFELSRVVDVTIPLRLVSEANMREHHMVRHRRKKAQQKAVALALFAAQGFVDHDRHRLSNPRPSPPCRITLTRIGKRRMDADNLAGSFKHAQDAVAKWLGIDDGDLRLTWRYLQETGRDYAVRILVEPWGEAHQAAADVGLEDA